jgi:hypothetical protein
MDERFTAFVEEYSLIENHGRGERSQSDTFLPLLPSGIAVIGIDSWVERFTKIFQTVLPDNEFPHSDSTSGKTWAQLPFRA